MIDCPNADVRDQLPDLVSGTLAGPARAIVESHLSGCADCRAEVALLTSVRGVLLADAPGVDAARIEAIVAALPSPVGGRRAGGSRSVWRSTLAGWRIAATVVFMAVGGAVVVLQSAKHANVRADSVAAAEGGPGGAAATPELALPDGLDSLSTEQLRSLLQTIDHLDGLPPAVSAVDDLPLAAGAAGRDSLSGGHGARS